MNKMKEWLKKTQPCLTCADFVSEVNSIDYRGFSDDELRKALSSFYGKTLGNRMDHLTVFAILKEVIFRLTGLRLFDSQLTAAYSIMNGRIAELPTGEGKTLAAVLPALIHAIQGFQVHILTFNDYLAERDYSITRPVYEFCGISVGFVTQNTPPAERMEMYRQDIVYLTAKEAGFDYLKNFLCTDPSEWIPCEFQYAIIDEADSILIDEAKNPLVIACDFPRKFQQIRKISQIVSHLGERDATVSKAQNQAYLTEEGLKKVEQFLEAGNLYEERNLELLSMVNMALQARFLLRRDVDYVIAGEKVHIVEESTGRPQNRHIGFSGDHRRNSGGCLSRAENLYNHGKRY